MRLVAAMRPDTRISVRALPPKRLPPWMPPVTPPPVVQDLQSCTTEYKHSQCCNAALLNGISHILRILLPVLLRVDAGDALEVAAEVGGGGEAQLQGGGLDGLAGRGVHDALGPGADVLAYVVEGGDAAAGLEEELGEVAGGVAQLRGIELHVAVLPVVHHHQVAEVGVEGCRLTLPSLAVLLLAVVVHKLVAHCQLREQHLAAQLQVIGVVQGYGGEQFADGHHAVSLSVGELTGGGAVEFVGVVAEDVRLDVVEQFRRDDGAGVGEVGRASHGPHEVAGHHDRQVVLVDGYFLHVIDDACRSAQTQEDGNTGEGQVRAGEGEAAHLVVHVYPFLLDVLHQSV